MNKHTPGPWRASPDQDARGWHGWRIDSDSRALMAWAAWPSEEERDSTEAESTARLIAAAPDLLAALLHVMPHVGTNYSGKQRYDILEPARAAIAKATGGK